MIPQLPTDLPLDLTQQQLCYNFILPIYNTPSPPPLLNKNTIHHASKHYTCIQTLVTLFDQIRFCCSHFRTLRNYGVIFLTSCFVIEKIDGFRICQSRRGEFHLAGGNSTIPITQICLLIKTRDLTLKR